MVSTLAAASQVRLSRSDIPELYDPNFLDVLIPPPADRTPVSQSMVAAETPKNSMMEALTQTAHQTLTQNLAPTYNSTLSPTLDAFQCLASAQTQARFNKYLQDAWAEDADLTLRIIWNTRSIHDGKATRRFSTELSAGCTRIIRGPRSRTSAGWWSLCALPQSKQALAHGYWKDLLNIVALAAVDELSNFDRPSRFLVEREQCQYGKRNGGKAGDPAGRIAESLAKDARNKEEAKEKRALKGKERYDNLVAKLARPRFRALYIAVARLFSDRLAQDLRILDELDTLSQDADRIPYLKRISLAGKWAPTPHGAHDRHTNIASAIALLLRRAQAPSRYPSALDKPIEHVEAFVILRSFYQRWVLTRLRDALAIPEPLMSANRWREIRYNRVSSVCMKNNMEHFFAHDPAGFHKYLASVEKGKKTISGATLLPANCHELKTVKEFKQSLKNARIRVVEAQWKTLIERLRESGSIDNALAVCDVSGSMGTIHYVPRFDGSTRDVQPILPAISLSLVLAYLAKPPFNGGFITFSANPEFVKLDLAQPLYKTILEMSAKNWGNITDLNAVFLRLLLPLRSRTKFRRKR
ncbi:putative protein with domain of unknown function (DUF2828) [Lyophyllum shimeji]|uniref:Uncharacterized protein n=1 Tax=Lyophyllum shimeji TaxID=47721 RepID=A0A9P3PM80_LYOSH|nr:putative protein with domain of unknown function (DUF2828) [Lyophyllum shimeji]